MVTLKKEIKISGNGLMKNKPCEVTLFPSNSGQIRYFVKDKDDDAIWRYAVIGVLLVALMLWRRWYAFFTVSFITAMLADCVLFKKKWYKPIVTIAVVGFGI